MRIISKGYTEGPMSRDLEVPRPLVPYKSVLHRTAWKYQLLVVNYFPNMDFAGIPEIYNQRTSE